MATHGYRRRRLLRISSMDRLGSTALDLVFRPDCRVDDDDQHGKCYQREQPSYQEAGRSRRSGHGRRQAD